MRAPLITLPIVTQRRFQPKPATVIADSGTCMRPYVKGQIVMANSIFNGARREDVWLDK
jgi:hypothetical protein